MVIYPSKLTYFSLRKPRVRTFDTAAAQNADFMDRHQLAIQKKLYLWEFNNAKHTLIHFFRQKRDALLHF
ncbi:MAG: hypothetical protein CSA04_03100 [Bacteroidetes bacterium]|nr:MAG: hypothetical protein CSA04_03100 [Bacteroidota bacterium]